MVARIATLAWAALTGRSPQNVAIAQVGRLFKQFEQRIKKQSAAISSAQSESGTGMLLSVFKIIRISSCANMCLDKQVNIDREIVRARREREESAK